MAANEKKYLISPDEGVHLSILDITHKVTAQDFGGAFTIIEAGLPPGPCSRPLAARGVVVSIRAGGCAGCEMRPTASTSSQVGSSQRRTYSQLSIAPNSQRG
jgi:hypothetical protein